jgi:hypothetical protein
VFNYDFWKDTWVLQYSENAINRYEPCYPSAAPTILPSRVPTLSPTNRPTRRPSSSPTARPTVNPSFMPTAKPSNHPSVRPSAKPSAAPSAKPSASPTAQPSSRPTPFPSMYPTKHPTSVPSRHPTTLPTLHPTNHPTNAPSAAPTFNSSRVEVTMLSAYRENWGGVHLIMMGPSMSVVLDSAGPLSMGTESLDLYSDQWGLYTVMALYPGTEPENVDVHDEECNIYWKLNFTGNSPPLVFHGTYKSSLQLMLDSGSDAWAIVSSTGGLSGYVPCTPTAAPTSMPTTFWGNGGTYDMVANRYVLQPWMEIGYTVLDDSHWVSIAGSFTNFIDPVVFLSLPNIPGDTSQQGYAASVRVDNATLTRANAYYSEFTWRSKIYLTNDSACSKRWYTPRPIDPPIALSWMIVERGAWNLSSQFFFVNKGPISRADDSLFSYNLINQENVYNCEVYDAACRFPGYVTVDNIGALTQIQTLVYDRFLLVRAYALNRRQGIYLLTPHDSADPAYYAMPAAETMAYMHFQGGVSVTCRESVTIETSLHRVTHFKQSIPYRHNFTVPPGVFGMVASILGQDSVGLRSFDRGNSGASFITQEDKCFDEETNHTSEEFVSIFVAGAVSETSAFKCDIVHNYEAPSTEVAWRDDSTYDMIRKRYITDVWMEIGYTNVDISNWVTVTTSFTNFSDPVVFLSLPDIPGETSHDGHPAIGRIRRVENVRHSDDNASTSFEAKLYLSNDSHCSKQWYTPVSSPPVPLSWMVAERGAWNLSSNFFFVNTGPIYREDFTYSDYNFISEPNIAGCTSPYLPCSFPDHVPTENLGAITQLQTLVYDRFLLVRGFSLNRQKGRYILTPHDAVVLSYYELWESESLGYMHFHGGVNLVCKERLTVETHIYVEAVTNFKVCY